MDGNDTLLTTSEVASLLKVNRTALWAWRRQGQHLPEPINIAPASSKRPCLRWRMSDLRAFIGGKHE